jgi:16S rRNA (uracil1498-N3)-methyltransferase
MPKALRVCHPGLEPGELLLPEAASRYVCRVHRVRVGGALLLFDPERGIEADAELLDAGKRARCRVADPRAGVRPGFAGLSLVLGRPKAPALERVLRDAVAFGVARLVLLDCEHSLPAAVSDHGTRRLSELVLDETRQCERSDLLCIEGPRSFPDALDLAATAGGMGRHVVLDPRGQSAALGRVLTELAPDLDQPGALSLWVGPEAGFSAEEIARLVRAGARCAVLGDFVLRVPTAASAALAATTIGFPRR